MKDKKQLEPRGFNREKPDKRKLGLILATLELISKQGVQAATVRAIAQQAHVTQGLIRHHFSSKEELISAAYEYYIQQMNSTIYEAVDQEMTSARERLARFITTALNPPLVNQQAIALWAGFFQYIQNNADMRSKHEKIYLHFRDKIELLIAETIEESGGQVKIVQLRKMAIAVNAVIDGLWLESATLRSRFSAGEITDIGLLSVGGILGIDLSDFMENS